MSGDYEQGFAAGERQAFIDRRSGRPPRELFDLTGQHTPDLLRGWWDGYTPRSPTWLRTNARAFSEAE